MRIYGVRLKVDVGDELSDKQVEEWVQDALGPAARAIAVKLEGRLATDGDCEDMLFSNPPHRIALTEGDLLIFRCDAKIPEKHVEDITERMRKAFDDKFKILILDGGIDMVVGEMVEKKDGGK